MKTKRDTLLPFLARREKLSHQEQLELLRALASRLKPYLHKMTLQEVGELYALGDDQSFKLNNFPSPDLNQSFELSTRGIYGMQLVEDRYPELAPEGYQFLGIYRGWGLTREGEWVTIGANVGIKVTKVGETNIYHRTPLSIGVRQTTVQDMFMIVPNITPRIVFTRIARHIINWETQCRERHRLALELAEEAQIAWTLLSINLDP